MPERADARTARSGRVSAAGAVAVLVALCALLPVVQGGRWWTTSLVFVVVAVVVGAASRRAGLPTPAAALVALTSVPLVATALAGGGSGLLLVVPTETSALAVLQAFQDAAAQIYADAVPAQDTPALALLIGASAGVAAVVVDAVAVGLRAPLAGMLVVVALALVPGKALGVGTDGALLVVVAAAVLLVVAADRRRRGSPPRLPGLAAGGAIAIVLTLLAQVVLPAPTASQAQGSLAPLFGTGVDPLVRLGENLRRGATAPVLTYTTTAEDRDLYLRLAVLEDFSGDAWTPNEADGRPLRFSQVPDAAGQSAGRASAVASTEIVPAGPGAVGERLPLPYPVTSVDGVVGADFRWEERGLTLVRDGGGGAVGPYVVESDVIEAGPEVLRRSGVEPPYGDQQAVTLPAEVPAVIRETVAAWTAGADTAYDQALAIQNRLREAPFSYDEETPAEEGYDGDGLGVVAEFLRVKAGYCVHYASTMAVMARLQGIPSRIVVGYQPGEAQTGSTARLVTSDDLHAWPELFFEGVGWVRFEPTPGQGAVPAYAPLPSAAASATPTAAPSRDAATPRPETSAGAAGTQGGGDAWAVLGPLLRGLGVALAALALLLVPALVRVLLRRRRLAAGGGAAWRELLDSLIDLGLPTGGGGSPRAVEQVLAAHLGGGAPREALARIRSAVERQAYSTGTAEVGAGDVRAVIDAAADRAGRRRRLVAALAPRSLAGTLARSRLAFGWSPPGSTGSMRRSPGR